MKLTPIIFFCLLLSCSSSEIKKMPSDILSPDNMVEVLADIHFEKGRVHVLRLNNPISQKQEDSLFQEIYKKHNISATILDSNLSFYTRKEPLKLKKIYSKVIEKLQEEEARIEN